MQFASKFKIFLNTFAAIGGNRNEKAEKLIFFGFFVLYSFVSYIYIQKQKKWQIFRLTH